MQDNYPPEFYSRYENSKTAEEKYNILNEFAEENENEMLEIVKQDIALQEKKIDSFKKIQDLLNNAPDFEAIKEDLLNGESATKLKLEISEKLGAVQAGEIVDSINQEITDSGVTIPEKTVKNEEKNNNSLIQDQTPNDIQNQFNETQSKNDEALSKLQDEVYSINEQLAEAKQDDPKISEIRKKSDQKTKELDSLKETLNKETIASEADLSDKISSYINENYELSKEDTQALSDSVLDSLTNKGKLARIGNTKISRLVEINAPRFVARRKQREAEALEKKESEKKQPEKKQPEKKQDEKKETEKKEVEEKQTEKKQTEKKEDKEKTEDKQTEKETEEKIEDKKADSKKKKELTPTERLAYVLENNPMKKVDFDFLTSNIAKEESENYARKSLKGNKLETLRALQSVKEIYIADGKFDGNDNITFKGTPNEYLKENYNTSIEELIKEETSKKDDSNEKKETEKVEGSKEEKTENKKK